MTTAFPDDLDADLDTMAGDADLSSDLSGDQGHEDSGATSDTTTDTASDMAADTASDMAADTAPDADMVDADVVDLERARTRVRRPHIDPDPDNKADTDNDADNEPDCARERVPVDSPDAQRSPGVGVSGWLAAERRPVFPTWMRSWGEFWAQTGRAAGYAKHVSGYHLVRCPKYLARIAGRSPRGFGRTVKGWQRWLWDLEGEQVRQALASQEKPDAEQYLKVSRQRDRRVRWRGGVTLVLSPLVVSAVVVAVLFAPALVQGLLVAAAVVTWGLLGRPADKPLLDTAVVRPKFRTLTSDVVVSALLSLKIDRITNAYSKDAQALTRAFVAPIHRDGPGYRAELDLPNGATEAEVVARRANLASSLGRPIGCVWPEGRPEISPGRLVLWVGDEDMSRTKQPAWPLEKSGVVDLFQPQPFGTDPRGRWVPITLAYASMAIGSVPRMGKTFALRELLLIAALDPRAELHPYDLKGTGDLAPLEPVAHRYRAGDDEDDIEYAIADLRAIREELRRRAKVIRGLPKEDCPDNQVNTQLASRRKLGLHPIVGGVDECQVWFGHKQYGAEFKDICVDLVKRGPAVGIWWILATQQPKDASLPKDISDNVVLRFCLKVLDHTANDIVLGTSMYQNGVRATMFSRNRDKGIGYLVGEGEDPVIARTVYIDAPHAATIVARARAVRERQNRLTGHALGEQPTLDSPQQQVRQLLDDVLTVCPPNEGTGKYWTQVLLDRLINHHPGAYKDWTTTQLGAALRGQGVATTQVWKQLDDGETGSPNRAGIDANQIAQLVADRNRKREADDAA